jgi:cell division protease FtsH
MHAIWGGCLLLLLLRTDSFAPANHRHTAAMMFFKDVFDQLRERMPKHLADPTIRRRMLYATFAWLLLTVVGKRLRAASGAGQLATTAAGPSASAAKEPVWLAFSDFLLALERGEVTKVLFGQDDVLEVVRKTPDAAVQFTRRMPSHLFPLMGELRKHQVAFAMDLPRAAASTPIWQSVMLGLVPVVYVAGLGWVLFRFFGPDAMNNTGKIGDEHHDASSKRPTSWQDVAGADQARDAVREVCQVLLDPARFKKAGARLPKGILLVGPPGTGKTMLARAMASEAGLPFFYCSGSDFVEVFAGRGAARVRSLFEKAAKNSPSVVFIDEIDALGGSRRSGGLSNNEEREQTLNQLLSCMDGFNSDEHVVVMAATNRFESLDRALVRPGRFDRVVRVDLPDEKGRLQILKVHTRHMKLAPRLDLAAVAEAAVRFSGAELAALANEAAIRAVRDEREELILDDFFQALASFASSRQRPSHEEAEFRPSKLVEMLQRNLDELD